MKHAVRISAGISAFMLITVFISVGSPLLAADDAMCIIINSQRPELELSRSDLVDMYIGRTQYWDDRSRIQLILPPKGGKGNADRFYEFLDQSRYQLRRDWAGMVFQGKVAHLPIEPKNGVNAVYQVRKDENAIAVVPVSVLQETKDTGLTIVSIDGKAPGDVGYPL